MTTEISKDRLDVVTNNLIGIRQYITATEPEEVMRNTYQNDVQWLLKIMYNLIKEIESTPK